MPSSDIYWGAIPWVILQLMLVAIVIFWPQSVTYWLDAAPTVDPSKIEIRIPTLELPTGPPSMPSIPGPPPGAFTLPGDLKAPPPPPAPVGGGLPAELSPPPQPAAAPPAAAPSAPAPTPGPSDVALPPPPVPPQLAPELQPKP